MSAKVHPTSQQLGKVSAHLSPKNYSTKRVQSITQQKRTVSIRSDNSATPSEMDLFQTTEDINANPVYREVTYQEIMKDYKPTSLAVYGFIASMIASLQLPLFGLVLSKYIFILAIPGYQPCP